MYEKKIYRLEETIEKINHFKKFKKKISIKFPN